MMSKWETAYLFFLNMNFLRQMREIRPQTLSKVVESLKTERSQAFYLLNDPDWIKEEWGKVGQIAEYRIMTALEPVLLCGRDNPIIESARPYLLGFGFHMVGHALEKLAPPNSWLGLDLSRRGQVIWRNPFTGEVMPIDLSAVRELSTRLTVECHDNVFRTAVWKVEREKTLDYDIIGSAEEDGYEIIGPADEESDFEIIEEMPDKATTDGPEFDDLPPTKPDGTGSGRYRRVAA